MPGLCDRTRADDKAWIYRQPCTHLHVGLLCSQAISAAALTLKAHIGLTHVGGVCICHEMASVLSELRSLDPVRRKADSQHGALTLWQRFAMLEIRGKFNKWEDHDD
eukprot:49454-Eustigmatos_ZCMA.PRE.1